MFINQDITTNAYKRETHWPHKVRIAKAAVIIFFPDLNNEFGKCLPIWSAICVSVKTQMCGWNTCSFSLHNQKSMNRGHVKHNEPSQKSYIRVIYSLLVCFAMDWEFSEKKMKLGHDKGNRNVYFFMQQAKYKVLSEVCTSKKQMFHSLFKKGQKKW